MKQCSVCQEDFADKFSFCPVDGTPLNGIEVLKATPVEETATIPATAPSENGARVSPVLQQTVASIDAEPQASASDSFEETEPVSSTVYDNEFHLTIIEDRTILGRLSEELKEVGHDA